MLYLYIIIIIIYNKNIGYIFKNFILKMYNMVNNYNRDECVQYKNIYDYCKK